MKSEPGPLVLVGLVVLLRPGHTGSLETLGSLNRPGRLCTFCCPCSQGCSSSLGRLSNPGSLGTLGRPGSLGMPGSPCRPGGVGSPVRPVSP